MGASESRPECPVTEKGERVKRGSFALKTIVGGVPLFLRVLEGCQTLSGHFPRPREMFLLTKGRTHLTATVGWKAEQSVSWTVSL